MYIYLYMHTCFLYVHYYHCEGIHPCQYYAYNKHTQTDAEPCSCGHDVVRCHASGGGASQRQKKCNSVDVVPKFDLPGVLGLPFTPHLGTVPCLSHVRRHLHVLRLTRHHSLEM